MTKHRDRRQKGRRQKVQALKVNTAIEELPVRQIENGKQLKELAVKQTSDIQKPPPKHPKAWKNSMYKTFKVLILILIVLFLVACVCLSLQGYSVFTEEHKAVNHFQAYAMKETSETTFELLGIMQGQMSANASGFFVGDIVSISLLLRLDESDYNQFINMDREFQKLFVANAEDVKDANRDISKEISQGNLTGAFIQPGILNVNDSFDDRQMLLFEGDVIFTEEGYVKLYSEIQPISLITQKYNLEVKEFYIHPRHAKYQIDLSKSTVGLAWITAALICLTIFVSLLSVWFAISSSKSR